MSEFSAVISTVSTCLTLGRALIDERDRQKAAAIQVELTEKLVQVQSQLLQVLATVSDQQAALHVAAERIRELEAREREKERYQLAELGSVGKFFAYRLRPAAELRERQDEPPHFLCQPCFDIGRKAVLHIGRYNADCPVCRNSVQIELRPPIRIRPARPW